MEFPKEVLSIVKRSIGDDKTGSPEQQCDSALKALRKWDGFSDLTEQLVRHSIQELVYDIRHQSNRQLKSESGYYGHGARAPVGKSAALKRSMRSYFELNVSGMTLGMVRCNQLPDLIEEETNQRNGHEFNRALFAGVLSAIPKEKRHTDDTVQSVLKTERRIREIVKAAESKSGVRAATMQAASAG